LIHPQYMIETMHRVGHRIPVTSLFNRWHTTVYTG
jgi:hypothetical protein